MTFFGPNGCGKTTLLNIVAGLIVPDSGQVTINGKPSAERVIGYMLQDYRMCLLPWRKNIDNVAFPLELKGVSRRQRRHRARALLENLDMKIDEMGYPYRLSGGQQQLLAIAQAIITDPDLLILDEPFSALDYQNRLRLQDHVLEIWRRTKKTVFFVSHEIDEAIYLGQRLVLFNQKPAGIIKIFQNDLSHPRTQDMIATEEFRSVKAEVIEAFQGTLTVAAA